jgi:hypothetical protein
MLRGFIFLFQDYHNKHHDPHHCELISHQILLTLSCEEAFQLAYEMSFFSVFEIMSEEANNNGTFIICQLYY